MQDELVRSLFEIVKGMLAVQRQHDELISALRTSYMGLLSVLSGQEPPASPASTAAIAKAAAEIAELERLFGQDPAAGGAV